MQKKITLNEWIQLSSEQRDEIKEKWKQNWNEWAYLLDEAIESFKNEYREIREISDVNSAYGCESVPPSYSVSRLITEPYISVTTSLKNNGYIKELPSEYAHFKVVQDPFGDTGQAYLEEWIAVLKNLLGWTEDETVAWAQKKHAEDLRGKNVWFNHEYPCYYIVDLLVPKDKIILVARIGESKFLGKIQRAIYHQNAKPLCPDYDWDTARQRVNDVLKEVNLSLPVL
jgi:hypothetical protein